MVTSRATTRRPPSMASPDHRGPWPDAKHRATKTNLCRSSMRSKIISAASPKKPRPMPATAARPIFADPHRAADRRLHRHRAAEARHQGRRGQEQDVRSRSLIERMSAKLKRAGYRSRYRLRKQTVEPVFGQIKQARGFRQFLLRGIEKVRAEWALICTAHNLTKLARPA